MAPGSDDRTENVPPTQAEPVAAASRASLPATTSGPSTARRSASHGATSTSNHSSPSYAPTLRAAAVALPVRVDAALDAFLLDDAASAIVDLLDEANRTLERAAPWRLRHTDPALAAASLYAPLEAARIAAGELSPFVPDIASAIASRLGTQNLAPTWGALVPGTQLRAGPPPVPRKQTSAT